MKNFNQIDSVELMQENVEAKLWAEYTILHRNPVLRQVGIFLFEFYNLEVIADIHEIPKMDERKLDPLLLHEAESWAQYFNNHSLVGLQVVAEFIPEWVSLPSGA